MTVPNYDAYFNVIPEICRKVMGKYPGVSYECTYVFEWIEKNGYTVIEAQRENYIDRIWNKEDEMNGLKNCRY